MEFVGAFLLVWLMAGVAVTLLLHATKRTIEHRSRRLHRVVVARHVDALGVEASMRRHPTAHLRSRSATAQI